MKKFFKWLHRRFHRCAGRVVYKYDAATSYRGRALGTGVVSICSCDVCQKPFATLETSSGHEQNVSVSVAVRQALDAPHNVFKGREFGNLINMQMIWGL
jgi:hypothetical protein